MQTIRSPPPFLKGGCVWGGGVVTVGGVLARLLDDKERQLWRGGGARVQVS